MIDGSYYDEEYFLKGTKSNYGGRFAPYIMKYMLPIARNRAKACKQLFNPKKVLVLGCARGYLVKAFRELGIEAYGIDISKWAIDNSDKMRKYLTLGDCSDLSKWKDKEFDLVVAEDVLEHIPIPNLYKAIKEACRVSSKHVLVRIPIVDNGVDKSHVSIYPIEWWIEQFSKYNFTLISKQIVEQSDGIISFIGVFKQQ